MTARRNVVVPDRDAARFFASELPDPRNSASRLLPLAASVGVYCATVMATCPLCQKRAGRRDCPAKSTRICAVCCGTMREVEIDCPSACVHLRRGRQWDVGRGNTTPARPRQEFSQQFVYRHGIAISALSQAIVDARARSPAMVDSDVRTMLEATVRTLESGLYYETLPEGSVLAASLYRSVKSVLDGLLEAGTNRTALKAADAHSILDFLISTCEIHSSTRPKSRRYLDWLAAMVPEREEKEEPNRLILP